MSLASFITPTAVPRIAQAHPGFDRDQSEGEAGHFSSIKSRICAERGRVPRQPFPKKSCVQGTSGCHERLRHTTISQKFKISIGTRGGLLWVARPGATKQHL